MQTPDEGETNEIHRLAKLAVKHIATAPDLKRELNNIGVDIGQLAYPIARAFYTKKRWEELRIKIQRSTEEYKKVKRRSPNRKGYQEEVTLAREELEHVRTDASRIMGGVTTKERTYLHKLILELESILNPKTEKPYRYMAALFNLFRLHAEKSCEECWDFTPSQTRCQREQILTCPNHRKVRDKVRKMAMRMSRDRLKPKESFQSF